MADDQELDVWIEPAPEPTTPKMEPAEALRRIREFAREHGADLPDDWVFDRGELYP